jgi:RNA exonuclease 1
MPHVREHKLILQIVTQKGQELARISIIDSTTGQNIFDHLVRPSDTVLDYRTQWSGMTASRLASATHTLSSIQKALFDPETPIITPHTILLGHSLECDLAAIKVRHPLCIDTALLYRNPKGSNYKPSLKWLAQRWLGSAIQTASSGHDSEEDAMTCVHLLKLKMAHGECPIRRSECWIRG